LLLRKMFISVLLSAMINFVYAADEVRPDILIVRERIKLATGYLLNHCDRYGRFTYRNSIDPAKKYGMKYNLLRHCGAVYALGMARELNPSAEIDSTIRTACNFLRDNSFFAPVEMRTDMKAIWTIHEKLDSKMASGNPIMAKLGGAGLGLIALVEDYKVGGKTKLEDMVALANFILFMQKPDGDFYYKYYPQQGHDKYFVSQYYSGEAILGLLKLYEIDKNSKWLKAADFGLYFLANHALKTGSYPPDHWVILATRQFLKYYTDIDKPACSKDLLFFHSATTAKLLMSQQILDRSTGIAGSFRAGGQTCPTSTRVEGMMAAYCFLPEKFNKLKDDIYASCSDAIKFLLAAQITKGDLSGGMPRSTQEMAGNDGEAISNNSRKDEIRIDYVQHSLSAFVMYLLNSQK